MALFDPYLLLDHVTIAEDNGAAEIGFPRHPHRGIETLSIVLAGEVGHRDSIGNAGTVSAGGAQWMTAGNGIYHEEMLAGGPDGGEFVQLWFNLPRAKKRVAPAYAGCAEPPTAILRDAHVQVIAGTFEGVAGAFQGIAVDPTILTAKLGPGALLELPTRIDDACLVYVLQGSLHEPAPFAPPYLNVYGSGDTLELRAGPDGLQAIVLVARPIHEPVLQYRSFVMNTPEDILETRLMMDRDEFGR